MRFMILVKADKNSEAGILPDPSLLEKMGKFNEELLHAGVMLAGEGLHPTSKGARVRFEGDKRTVLEGPFPESRDLVSGFWIWRVNSRQEAINWLKRAPFDGGAEIEIRQIYEPEDFGDALSPELREQEARHRREVAGKK